MKRIIFAIFVLLVAGLAAVRLQAGAEAPDPVRPVAVPEPPGSPDPVELARAAEDARPAERGQPAEGAEAMERAEATESAEVAERMEAAGRTEGAEREETAEPTRTAEAAEREDGRDRRRYRRWRRNRYPGPIPTPEEWEPPEGPVRIGLQVGHWRTEEAPPELSGLRGNGTRWGQMHEWQVNLEIARRTGAMLEELGYEVDLLPAVVPPGYRAHLFIAIHADGSNSPAATGFRVAAPRRDATGRASGAVELLERTYGESTGLPRVPTVTRRMRSYYAFNFRRYEHALHPMTIGVIIETGYLTSPRDRRIIVDDPDRAAQGIVEAVKAFPHTPPPQVVDRQ